jgi:hypothetical protein
MNKLLISSCFNPNPLFALAVYCLDSGRISFVDLSAIPHSIHFRGISGLAKVSSGFVAGLQSNGPSKLLFLDEALRVVRVESLQLTADIHSIVHYDGTLFMVSTGNDSVVVYDIAARTETLVRCLGSSAADTVHLNGLCLHQGRVFVSMFGVPTPKSMRCGSVAAVDTGETVLGGLRHPHSLTSARESLMLAESLTGALVSFDTDGRLRDQRPGYFGYLRGLGIIDGRVIVGRSKKRKVSRSTGASVEGANAMDWLSVEQPALYDITEGKAAQEVDLLPFFDEVYELLPFRAQAWLNLVDAGAPAASRLHAAALEAQRCGDVHTCVEKLLAIPCPSAPQLMMLSKSLHDMSDAEGAWTTASLALKNFPGYAENLHWMSKLLEFRGDLPAALEHAIRATELNDAVAIYALQRGDLLRRMGHFADAIVHLERAIALNSRLEVAEKSLAAALAESDRNEMIGSVQALQRLTDWRAV